MRCSHWRIHVSVEITIDQKADSHAPEEQRHCYVSGQDSQIEGEKSPCIQGKSRYEVHDDAEDKCLRGHVESIDEDLGDPERTGSMEGVSSVFIDDGPTECGAG